MPYGNIDVTLTPVQITAIKDAFAAVETLMPWLVTLTIEERQRLYKAGDKLAVIEQARDGVVNNPGIFPASFDAAGFGRDVALFQAVSDLTQVAAEVWRKLDDTRIAVGSECMQAVSGARTYIDAAAKTTPGLQALSSQLAAHFKHTGSAKAPATPA